MTGKEAWSIVAPLLATHIKHGGGDLDTLLSAYVTTYQALSILDKTNQEKGR